VGSWKGSATLTNDFPPSSCRYEGVTEPPAVILKLQTEDGHSRVVVRLEVPGATGSQCPPLHKRYEIADVKMMAASLTFTDPAGHDWALTLRDGKLTGLVSWKGGGTDEPLAEGFVLPDRVSPLTRLSGEVTLTRSDGGGDDATAAGAAPAKKSGSHFLPGFLLANVIGVGAFFGIKKLSDDTNTTGTATCSPRFCVFAGLSDPCVCNINITAGASCGSTTQGVAFGGACNDTDMPCQAGLSCNNNICDDRTGRCPF
jgi:hypothetical protein